MGITFTFVEILVYNTIKIAVASEFHHTPKAVSICGTLLRIRVKLTSLLK